MANKDAAFTGSTIPEIYDTYMVPLIFEGYAADLAQRMAALKPKRVLEIAAGTGVVTRAVVPRLAEDARYYATDLNQAMIDRAGSRQKDPRILWQQADALALPYPDKDFDAVLCQFGVMFFPDRSQGYREARRVLKPGGLYAFNAWDSLANNDFPRLIAEACAELTPKTPSTFLARTPYGYHDTKRIEADLKEAGFSNIKIETIPGTSKAPGPRDPAIAFCKGSPLGADIAANGGDVDKVIDRAAALIAKAFGAGAVTAKIQAHVVTARA